MERLANIPESSFFTDEPTEKQIMEAVDLWEEFLRRLADPDKTFPIRVNLGKIVDTYNDENNRDGTQLVPASTNAIRIIREKIQCYNCMDNGTGYNFRVEELFPAIICTMGVPIKKRKVEEVGR
jgi:beta-glucosidase-like glycosyl hydrolase